jgi:hypothetical protein
VRLARAVLTREGKGLAFSLKAKIQGSIKADLLYAGTRHMATGLFTCPAAGLFEPSRVDFLACFPIRTDMAPTIVKEASPWSRIDFPLDLPILAGASDTAASFELLSRLDASFSASREYTFLWDESRITPQSLGTIASSVEKAGKLRFHSKIELTGKRGHREVARDSVPFAPNLRQTIACTDERGEITGGVVSISVDRP